jgi:hypothetical protein
MSEQNNAQFGSPQNIQEAGAYKAAFGHLGDKTPYHSGLKGMTEQEMLQKRGDVTAKSIDEENNKRDNLLKNMATKGGQQIQGKALTTTSGGAGTAGNALVPVYVDPRIVDQSRQYTPWTEMIPRVTNQGTTADYNVITDKEDAVFAGEGAALSDQDNDYDRKSEQIKYLYAKGKVTGPSQAATPSYMLSGFRSDGDEHTGNFQDQNAQNAKQLQVLSRARAFREREEEAIWNGDSGSNSLEYDGLVTLQSTTNQVDKSGAALEYDDIESAMELAVDGDNGAGRPNVAGASSNAVTQARQIMVDTFNYRPADMNQQLRFGISSQVVLETRTGPVPLIGTNVLDNTDGNKSMYFLDMDYIEMRTLMDMTMKELPDEDDSEAFLLKAYEAMIMRAPQFNAFIDNIA